MYINIGYCYWYFNGSYSNVSDLLFIFVMDSSLADLTIPCSENNGNCSHLCLLSASSNSSGYSCLCPFGMMLDTNERDCLEGESMHLSRSHSLNLS